MTGGNGTVRRRCAILALIAGLGGCTFTHTTDLFIPPPDARPRIGGAETMGVKVSVSDLRRDKTQIGTGRNEPPSGANVKVVSRQPVDAVIGRAIEAEFAARGFNLGGGPAFLLVDVKAVNSEAVWAMFHTAVMGEVVLAAQVLNPDGRILYTNQYRQREHHGNAVLIGHEEEGKVQLEIVLAAAIRSLAEDDGLIEALVDANRRR